MFSSDCDKRESQNQPTTLTSADSRFRFSPKHFQQRRHQLYLIIGITVAPGTWPSDAFKALVTHPSYNLFEPLK